MRMRPSHSIKAQTSDRDINNIIPGIKDLSVGESRVEKDRQMICYKGERNKAIKMTKGIRQANLHYFLLYSVLYETNYAKYSW